MLDYLKDIVRIFDENRADLKKTTILVEKINALEETIQALTDEQLEAQTQKLRAELDEGKTLEDILPEAFATVREASVRHTGLRHYDVQLIGGVLLHWGKVAEMKTGEGKTLVATLPTYLNALAQKGVHVVTVNDYLARRDAVWVGQIYSRLGMTIGVINSDNTSFMYDKTYRDEFDQERDEVGSFKIVYEFLKPSERKESYEADITYGTNSEFGFDYLRDNIVFSKEGLRQRALAFAIVDEMDSILIDEARVPLIISAPKKEQKELYTQFNKIAETLILEEDYDIDEKTKTVILQESGIDKAERSIGVSNMYSEKGMILVDYLETALKAKSLYKKEKEYVVKDGDVVIVDEFTGRMQPGRRWSGGLHQALEAKEGLIIREESQTYASVTYQNYFKLYDKLCGMTGTAETSKEEFFKVYGLDVVVVPTHVPVARIDKKDLVFATELGKFKAIAEKIQSLNEKGQPVLVGTASVEKSELLSEFLVKKKIKHTVLNAKNHEKEGEIIANAGTLGAVTIATNMAGRGVDIKLGGPLATEEQRQEVLEKGGLYVLGTERHESRRTDNQLRGRSGRQGDAGETRFFISLDDALMRVFGNQEFMKKILAKKVELEGGADTAIESKIMSRNVEKAQEKIEGFHFDSRKNVLQYDDVLDIQRNAIYTKRRKILIGEVADVEDIFKQDFASDHDFLSLSAEKQKALGDSGYMNFVRKKYLETIDTVWVEHLNVMEHLKSAVSLQSYGQKDPVLEYKREARKHFEGIFDEVKSKIKKTIVLLDPQHILESMSVESQMQKQAEDVIAQSGKEGVKKSEKVTLKKEKIVGRNELCHCGSGKKFKRCHGKK